MKFIITSLVFLLPLVAFTQDIIILKSGDTLYGQILSTDEDESITHFKNKNEQTVSISKNQIKQKNGRIFVHDTIPQGWIPGYILMKGKTDTIYGYLKIKIYMGRHKEVMRSISFCKNLKSKKDRILLGLSDSYFEDTIRYLGFHNRHFKYINYKDEEFPAKRFQYSNKISGWVEIKQKGAINLCKGFSVESGSEWGMSMPAGPGGPATGVYGGSSVNFIPMYSLKEGDAPTALIAAPSLSIFGADDYMLYEIDKSNKEHFINQINENAALAKRVSGQKLLFGDIEGIVKEYNQWKKSKQ